MAFKATTWARPLAQASMAEPSTSLTLHLDPLLSEVLKDDDDLVSLLNEHGYERASDLCSNTLAKDPAQLLAEQLSIDRSIAAECLATVKQWQVGQKKRKLNGQLAAGPSSASPPSFHSLSYHSRALQSSGSTSSPTPTRTFRPIPPPPPPPLLVPSATPSSTSGSSESEAGTNATGLSSGEESIQNIKLEDDHEETQKPAYMPPPILVPDYLDEPPLPLASRPPAIVSGIPRLDQVLIPLQYAGEEIGLLPGEALEILGPTASGKTRLGLQMVLKGRLAAILKRCEEQAESSIDMDQALIIDTEGGLGPDMIRSTLRRLVADLNLPNSRQEELQNQALAGLHLVRPTSDAELIAILRILMASRPSPSHQSSGLPRMGLLSTLFLDSTSYLLRTTQVDSSAATSTRQTRLYLYQLLSFLHLRLHYLNARLRVIVTNQMSLKMYSPQGELVDYLQKKSIARMVPQLEGSGLDHSGKGWTGSLVDAGSQRRGHGILGEGVKRVLLFRTGSQRIARLVWPGTTTEEEEGQKQERRDEWIEFTLRQDGLISGK